MPALTSRETLRRLPAEPRGEPEHEKGDQERRDVLRALMSEGMFFVGGLSRNAEGDEKDETAPAVGQVVESVRDDRDEPRQKSRGEFRPGKQRVQKEPQGAHPNPFPELFLLPFHPFPLFRRFFRQNRSFSNAARPLSGRAAFLFRSYTAGPVAEGA